MTAGDDKREERRGKRKKLLFNSLPFFFLIFVFSDLVSRKGEREKHRMRP